jgi:hypothetical protein
VKRTRIRHHKDFGSGLESRFRTGVSLHSHTLHSKESLQFLVGIVKKLPGLAWVARRESGKDQGPDYSRLWWTPPLSAMQALRLESSQIEKRLDLRPLVCLTDHDNIDAPAELSFVPGPDRHPISVEWTAPFRETFFHLGVHNLPPAEASGLFSAMRAATELACEERLASLLAELSGRRDTLIVFNHPMWDEKGIGRSRHWAHVSAFLAKFGPCLHALEFNGLRPIAENRQTIDLARAVEKPVVAGGDRHGREPSSALNVTEASCFAEFAEQVRRYRISEVVLMPQQDENRKLRVIQAICEILREDPEHSLGWRRWNDRIFYRADSGEVLPLAEVWKTRGAPAAIRSFVAVMNAVDALLSLPPMRSAIQAAFPRLPAGESAS